MASLNLASGRDGRGESLPAPKLAAAVAGLDADVVAVQEVDTGQPRSHGVDQAAVVADALGAPDWRYAAVVHGEPRPAPHRSWVAIDPVGLRGPGDEAPGPRYGVALFSRKPVRRWHVTGLGTGRAWLPVPATGPETDRPRLWWFPDEPRVAIAAELDGLTVVATHLSFAPHTATRQLRALRSWTTRLPGPVLVAGDLNLPGPLPALLTGTRRLIVTPTFPAIAPRVQLDHLLASGELAGHAPMAERLEIGDHCMVSVAVTPTPA